ncbi:MAG: hypothetical protein QOI06_1483 [Nocardioidaceae bacterium]|jgi:hypothetical protein|nr:hypothetical protein [Nocardioidaceae bacterium]
MSKGIMRHLWGALRDLTMGELLQIDFWLALLGGAGALALALNEPSQALAPVGVASQVVGVIIGAVIAGVAIQVAFLDQPFLRKLRAINRDPIRYLAPFLFTTVIGVFALLGLMVVAAMTPDTPSWALVPAITVTAFFSVWSVASLLPGLATLVQFVGLRQDALDLPDDVDITPARKRDEDSGDLRNDKGR